MLIVAGAHVALVVVDYPSPTLFTQTRVSERYSLIRRYEAEKGSIDTIIVGFSRALNGVDPAVIEEKTGKPCFNMAFASSDLLNQSMLVRDYLIPRFRPQTILWGLPFASRGRFKDNYQVVASAGYRIQRFPLGPRLVERADDLFYWQRRPLTDWALTVNNPRDLRNDENGFRGNLRRWSDELAGRKEGRMFAAPPAWELPYESGLIAPPREKRLTRDESSAPYSEADVYLAFEEALSLARERGIRILAFTVPVTEKRLRMERHWQRKVQYADRMNGLMESHGVPCADYRWYPAISEDFDLFYNNSHLNREGARVFTEILHGVLIEDGARIPEGRRGLFSPTEREAVRRTPRGRKELGPR